MVWNALLRIPYGDKISYQEFAASFGAANAVRAVGAAIGKNPLPIIIPCHRVIGSDGAMRGYLGGVAIKRWLLDHEAAQSQGVFTRSKYNEDRVAAQNNKK